MADLMSPLPPFPQRSRLHCRLQSEGCGWRLALGSAGESGYMCVVNFGKLSFFLTQGSWRLDRVIWLGPLLTKAARWSCVLLFCGSALSTEPVASLVLNRKPVLLAGCKALSE